MLFGGYRDPRIFYNELNVLLVGMSSLLIATDKRDYFYQN